MSEATLEAVAKSVHDLSEAVTGMQAGLVDPETVDRMAADLSALQAEFAEIQNSEKGLAGVLPDDVEDIPAFLQSRKPIERIQAVLDRPADRVASLIRRPVADVEHFQATSDNLLVLATALGYFDGETETWRRDPSGLAFYGQEFVPAMRAAMDSTTAAEGDEFVPTGLSASYIRRVHLPLKVGALFPFIDMPTQPYEVPGAALARVRGGKATEQTADTGQTTFKKVTPGTRKVTLTAVKFAVEVLWSKELTEDSIIPILPFIQEEVQDFMAADLEDAFLNGDTAGTHQDSDTTDADDPRKNWDGLRKKIIAGTTDTDASNAALTVAMLRTDRSNMGKYGIDPNQIVHVIGMANYIQLIADSNVITIDKYGDQATIRTGELGKVGGVSIVVSEYQRQDLNATGVYDGVTTNRSYSMTIRPNAFFRGQRRGMTTQMLREKYANSDQDAMIASHRQAFAERYPTSTETTIAGHFNLST